jgi:mRNA deadenylase 3'-5' endonuclease subunit Ccr4
MSADIICLQEVSAKGLKDTFIPNLKHIGLECFGYAPSKTADKAVGKYGHKHVGCAIFGKVAKFDIISSKRVHLRDFGGQALELSRSHTFHVDFTGKWNSMAITMLRLRETKQVNIPFNRIICRMSQSFYFEGRVYQYLL